MSSSEVSSLPGVVAVSTLVGERAAPDAMPSVLVEVPHGADCRGHYDQVRARLVGELPDDLHEFFHANTDMGAFAYGRRVAELLLDHDPTRTALLLRCLVPRTFVDTNRIVDADDNLATGGLTAAIPSYVRHEDDRALLAELHHSYVEVAESAYAMVCGAGGFALCPHTYGPRTMEIARVDDSIVEALRREWRSEVWKTRPLRPEVDLITKDEGGTSYAPAGLPSAVRRAFFEAGIDAVDSETYTLHPQALVSRFATAYPQQVLAIEVRRDLLVEKFELLSEMTPDPAAVDRVATPLAGAIHAHLAERKR